MVELVCAGSWSHAAGHLGMHSSGADWCPVTVTCRVCMQPEQMLEGRVQIAENPHSEYGLTCNGDRIVERRTMQKSNQNRKWVCGLCHLVPTWIRQLCLSYYRDFLCLQREDHQIPVNF